MNIKGRPVVLRTDFMVTLIILFSMNIIGPQKIVASMPLQITTPLTITVDSVEHSKNNEWELVTVIYRLCEDKKLIGLLTVKRLNFGDGAMYSHFVYTPKSQCLEKYITLSVPLIDSHYSATPLKIGSRATFFTSQNEHLFISPIQIYDISNTSYFIKKETTLEPKLDDSLDFELPIDTTYISELWYISSRTPLVDFQDEKEMDLLKRMNLDDKRQWSFFGNMYPVPATYSGAGTAHFWSNHAYHMGNKLLLQGSSAFSKYFSLISAEHILANYPQSGYILTPMKSSWLEADYNISGPFYDTRFNTDAAQFLINIYKTYQIEDSLTAVKNHYNFFTKYILTHKISMSDENWGISDYGNLVAGEVPTHGSLNHWLAEACLLYEYYILVNDKEALKIADCIINGIVAGGTEWKKTNGDLWYGYHEQKGFMLPDYIDVTYIDLLHTQDIYTQVHGTENSFLNWLIKTKKQFIDSQPNT